MGVPRHRCISLPLLLRLREVLLRYHCRLLGVFVVFPCSVTVVHTYAHLPHALHCRSFDPMDRRSFLPGWAGSLEECSDFRLLPSGSHSVASNLGSLLPSWRCLRAQRSNGSSL